MYNVPKIDDETFQLYNAYCDIKDVKTLERHLIEIQKDLSAVKNYKCIQEYKFAFSRIYYRFFYQHILDHGRKLVEQGQEAYFLDIGCCTGTDLRQLYMDGYPKPYLVGLDMEERYIECGYRLFKDSKETCPIQFIVGDLFGDLQEWADKISVIHAGSVLHLFQSEEMNWAFIRQIKRWLKRGGILVGGHVIAERSVEYYRNEQKKYYIGTDRFRVILESEGFREVELKMTRKDERDSQGPTLYWVSFFAVFNPAY